MLVSNDEEVHGRRCFCKIEYFISGTCTSKCMHNAEANEASVINCRMQNLVSMMAVKQDVS